MEYSRVCSIEKSGPKWQRNLDKELTKEQEKEAKEFFEIMSQCLSTSGRECRCEDISVPAFSEKCSIIAPLEIKCDEGDEESCELSDKEAEDIEDLLPDHLLDALFDATDNLDEDRFDSRAPRECVEAGANDRESCFKIMFELNAPEECVEAGLRNQKECGKLMFKLNAPQECIDAGLTGESRGDEKKCRRRFGQGCKAAEELQEDAGERRCAFLRKHFKERGTAGLATLGSSSADVVEDKNLSL